MIQNIALVIFVNSQKMLNWFSKVEKSAIGYAYFTRKYYPFNTKKNFCLSRRLEPSQCWNIQRLSTSTYTEENLRQLGFSKNQDRLHCSLDLRTKMMNKLTTTNLWAQAHSVIRCQHHENANGKQTCPWCQRCSEYGTGRHAFVRRWRIRSIWEVLYSSGQT